jgi:hypothetical protein
MKIKQESNNQEDKINQEKCPRKKTFWVNLFKILQINLIDIPVNN